jgi:N-dimethylarginine dimethylaminohydrolase
MQKPFLPAAWGGAGWTPRTATLRSELGEIWSPCGVATEWSRLKRVLLHRPGDELAGIEKPHRVQMLEKLDPEKAAAQHDSLAEAYRQAEVDVHYVNPEPAPEDRVYPNLMFVADLFCMTPQGAVLARPASAVRAGEERWVARRLADLGIPILRSILGTGTFEGADCVWLDPQTALLATGLRTNAEGAAQVTDVLTALKISVEPVGLPYGAMHLMGTLRFLDRDLAVVWPGRVPFAAVKALRRIGCTVLFAPSEQELVKGLALNFVTLGPREILMAEGNPVTQAFLEKASITCHTVAIDELAKGAGGIACLTGVLQREIPGHSGYQGNLLVKRW